MENTILKKFNQNFFKNHNIIWYGKSGIFVPTNNSDLRVELELNATENDFYNGYKVFIYNKDCTLISRNTFLFKNNLVNPFIKGYWNNNIPNNNEKDYFIKNIFNFINKKTS